MKWKVTSFDEFAHVCPFFTSECSVNNGYGCTQPDQEESDFDEELGRDHGKCYSSSCPLGVTPDEEDFDNPDVDWDGITREDCTVDGEFDPEPDFLMVNVGPDATEDEKRAMKAYDDFINRYNPDYKREN